MDKQESQEIKPSASLCLKAVLLYAPGLTDRDRALIQWGFNLADEELCTRYAAEDWISSILYPYPHRQKV